VVENPLVTVTHSYQSTSSLERQNFSVAAFHKCHLYSSISCSIPEFVRSIAICLCHSPLTKDFYSRHVLGDENLRQLILDDEASLGVEPLELFRLLVLRPLRLYESSISTEKAGGDHKHRESSSNGQDEGALIILVDAVDEASMQSDTSIVEIQLLKI